MGNIVCKRFVPKPRSNIYYRFYVTGIRYCAAIDEEWAARFPTLNVEELHGHSVAARDYDGKLKLVSEVERTLEDGTVQIKFMADTTGTWVFYRREIIRPTEARMFQFLSYTERTARNRMLQIVLRNAEKTDDGNYFGLLGMDLCTRICFFLVEDVRWRKRGEPRERC